MSKAEDLAVEIRTRFDRYIDGFRKVYPVTSNRASNLGNPCDYSAFLERVAWDQKQAPSLGLQKIFKRGQILEPMIRNLLQELGIEIEAVQRPVNYDSLELTGHYDGMIGDSATWGKIVVEIKTTGSPILAQARTADDIRKTPIGEKWFAQCQIYMIAAKEDISWTILIVYDVMTGDLNAIPIELDYEYAEGLLQRAERVNAAVKVFQADPKATVEIPDVDQFLGVPRISNAKICRRCPHFGTSCNPDLDLGENVKVLADDELESALRRREELAPLAHEFKVLDTDIKDQVKWVAPEVVVGDFVITNSPRERANYKVPNEIRDQYKADPTRFISTTIEFLPPPAKGGPAEGGDE